MIYLLYMICDKISLQKFKDFSCSHRFKTDENIFFKSLKFALILLICPLLKITERTSHTHTDIPGVNVSYTQFPFIKNSVES